MLTKMPGKETSSKCFRLSRLAGIMIATQHCPDTYISQCSFVRPQRKIMHLQEMGSAWVDIDCYKLEGNPKCSPELVKSFVETAFAMGIPRPSYAINSGRGVYLKWIFEKPVGASSLVTWNILQETLVAVFKSFGADNLAKDAARVLRAIGTTNSKVSETHRVSVVGEVGEKIAFNDLCLAVSTARFTGQIPACRQDKDLAWGFNNDEDNDEVHEQGNSTGAGGRTVKEGKSARLKSAGQKSAGLKSGTQNAPRQLAEPAAAVRAKKKLKDQIDIEAATSRTDLEGLVAYSAVIQPRSLPSFSAVDLSWKRFIDLRDLMIMRQGAISGERDLYLFWMLVHLSLVGAVNTLNFEEQMKSLAGLIDPEWREPFSDGSMSTLFGKVRAHLRLSRAGKIGPDHPTPIYTAKNEHLIELFEITGEEMRHLCTLIDAAEKLRRSDILHPGREERRNRREDNRFLAAKMLYQGSNISQVMKETGMSSAQVVRVHDDVAAMSEVATIIVPARATTAPDAEVMVATGAPSDSVSSSVSSSLATPSQEVSSSVQQGLPQEDLPIRLTPKCRRPPFKLKGMLFDKLVRALGNNQASRAICEELGFSESVVYRAKRMLLDKGILLTKGQLLSPEELLQIQEQAEQHAAERKALANLVIDAKREANMLMAEARQAQLKLQSSVTMQSFLDSALRNRKMAPEQIDLLAAKHGVAYSDKPAQQAATDRARALISATQLAVKAAEKVSAEATAELSVLIRSMPAPSSLRYAPGHGPKPSKRGGSTPARADQVSTPPGRQLFKPLVSQLVHSGQFTVAATLMSVGLAVCAAAPPPADGPVQVQQVQQVNQTHPSAEPLPQPAPSLRPECEPVSVQIMTLLDETESAKPSGRSALDKQLANLAKAKAVRDRLAAEAAARKAEAVSVPKTSPVEILARAEKLPGSVPTSAQTSPAAPSSAFPAARGMDPQAEVRQTEMRRRSAERLAAFQRSEESHSAADRSENPVELPWEDLNLPAGSSFTAEQWAAAADDGLGGKNIVFEMRSSHEGALVVLPRKPRKPMTAKPEVRANDDDEQFVDPIMAMMYEGCLVLGPKAQCSHPSHISGTMTVRDEVLGPWKYRILRPLAHKEDRFYMFGANGWIKFQVEKSVQAHVAEGTAVVIRKSGLDAADEADAQCEVARGEAPRG